MKRYEKTHYIKMDVCVLMLQKIFRQGINSIIIMLFLEIWKLHAFGFSESFLPTQIDIVIRTETKGLISF